MANVVRDDKLVVVEAPAISLRGDDGTEYARIENGVGTGLLNSGSIPSPVALSLGGALGSLPLGRPVVTSDHTAAFKLLAESAIHNGFPSACFNNTTTAKKLIVVWRRGTAHDSGLGAIQRAFLDFSTGTPRLVNSAGVAGYDQIVSDATYDCRDPKLALLANGNVILTYYKRASAGTPGGVGVYVRVSSDGGVTFGAEVQVTSNFTKFVQQSGRAVEWGDKLWQPLYGSSVVTAPAVGDLATVSYSTDGGATWTAGSTILDGTSSGVNLEISETCLYPADDGSLVAAVRVDGANEVRFYRTTDGSTWTDGNASDANITHVPGLSSPSMFGDDTGLVVTVLRDPVTLKEAFLYWSTDSFSTVQGPILLTDGGEIDPTAPWTNYTKFDYFGAGLIAAGQLAVVYSMEESTNHADLWLRFAQTRSSVTPAGVLAVTAPAFAPASSPKLWLKADAITGLSDGAAISTWSDQSGNSNDATQSGTARPVWTAAAYHSSTRFPGVTFDGSNDAMKVGIGLAASDGKRTVFVVSKRNSTGGTASQTVIGARNSTTGWEQRLTATGLTVLNIGTGGTNTAKTNTVTLVAIRRTSYDGTSIRAAYNGAETALLASAYNAYTPPQTFIGAEDSNDDGTADANFLAGVIFEVLVYDRMLTPNEIFQTEAYLANKYGVTLS